MNQYVRPPREVTLDGKGGRFTIKRTGSHPEGLFYIYTDDEISFAFLIAWRRDGNPFDVTIAFIMKSPSGGHIEVPVSMRTRVAENIISFFKTRYDPNIHESKSPADQLQTVGFGWDFVK
jgi:hypothetical protein